MASSRRSASKPADLPGDVVRALAGGRPDADAPSSLITGDDRHPPVSGEASASPFTDDDAPEPAAVQHCIAVAFSGGLDSTALLHAAVQALGPGRVLAVHVDHRLQPGSGDWAEHCRKAAQALGVSVRIERLAQAPARGDSVEAWARDARYAAIARACAIEGVDTVLTAHHADDQAETLLLRLARGTGPDGLAGIAPMRREGVLTLVRPLLARHRDEIAAWARAAGLTWLDDPSNTDPRFRRNALRAEVMPALARAVPGAVRAIARAAGLAQEARAVLAEIAATDLASVRRPDAPPDDLELDRARLLGLPPARRAWALRHWLSAAGARPPSAAQLDELLRQLLEAQAPSGVLALDDQLVLRHRDRLLVVPGAAALQRWLGRLAAATGPVGQAMDRPGRYPVGGGVGAWEVALVAAPCVAGGQDDAGMPAGTQTSAQMGAQAGVQAGVPAGVPAAALRSGGLRFETGARTNLRLRPQPGGPSRSLKNLSQEQGLPGWLRPLFPVLADGDRALWSDAFGADRPDPADAGAVAVSEQRILRWCPTGEPVAATRLKALFARRHPV